MAQSLALSAFAHYEILRYEIFRKYNAFLPKVLQAVWCNKKTQPFGGCVYYMVVGRWLRVRLIS